MTEGNRQGQRALNLYSPTATRPPRVKYARNVPCNVNKSLIESKDEWNRHSQNIVPQVALGLSGVIPSYCITIPLLRGKRLSTVLLGKEVVKYILLLLVAGRNGIIASDKRI